MSRPAANKQYDYIISKETSKASMYGMDWLEESTLQPASHLDSHCHGDIPNMSKKKTICGGFDKRIEILNVAVPHKGAYQNN
jgi:hypothetical protein